MSDTHAPIKRISHFRFYEELNDFLEKERCKKNFPVTFTGHPAVKDIIESLGVPHTEVDLILVNSRSVDFNYKLQGGEQISVYPVFELLDITSLQHLRPKPLRNNRFIADVNLGKLARMLRLLGFDTLYQNNYTDTEIIRIAAKEKRIILTRDRGILKHHAVTHGYWIRNHLPERQLTEIIEYFHLQNCIAPFIRCSICNGLLHPVDKKDIIDRLPKRTAEYHNSFVECDCCHKIYWKGSHYHNIQKMINRIYNHDRL
ncbi:MAG: Mut7-C ubiquitin/RNAse domain-containing protein [Candidatus Marinimicrobia bacterium]|nr:Mut7-C ubiquitin/RNAse domain-containing protein [Candidatus Neomarinimicrobiota bacterium]RKY59912.1 MAG: twitching motility protein PilT [Candidatus Neomarinimicrobiota bacterium]